MGNTVSSEGMFQLILKISRFVIYCEQLLFGDSMRKGQPCFVKQLLTCTWFTTVNHSISFNLAVLHNSRFPRMYNTGVRFAYPIILFLERTVKQQAHCFSQLERASQLASQGTQLEPRSLKFLRIKNRVSSWVLCLVSNCQLTFEQYCNYCAMLSNVP